MMVYNISFMNSSNTFIDYYTGLNASANDGISIIFLVVFWVIIFISTKHFDTKVSFLTASFTTTIIGVFFLSANFITYTTFIFPLILTMFSVIAYLFMKD